MSLPFCEREAFFAGGPSRIGSNPRKKWGRLWRSRSEAAVPLARRNARQGSCFFFSFPGGALRCYLDTRDIAHDLRCPGRLDIALEEAVLTSPNICCQEIVQVTTQRWILLRLIPRGVGHRVRVPENGLVKRGLASASNRVSPELSNETGP